jgi:hypothetical protein
MILRADYITLHHAAHAAACVLFLIELQATQNQKI